MNFLADAILSDITQVHSLTASGVTKAAQTSRITLATKG